jgi:hypothetical protein
MKFATCLSGFTGRRMVTLAPRIAANFNMTLLDGSIRTNSLIKRVFAGRKLGCCLGKYSLRFRICPRSYVRF